MRRTAKAKFLNLFWTMTPFSDEVSTEFCGSPIDMDTELKKKKLVRITVAKLVTVVMLEKTQTI